MPGRAREGARKNGAAREEEPERHTGTVGRRDGREPLGLGSAISRMMGLVSPQGYPYPLAVDRQGRIAAARMGQIDRAELAALVEPLL
ncbi:TlpA family protein disulfide reductase [Streptomyces hygroscopicus]|uniref:TlpA family protein disulfide reductase n=1 Tax=Streptomyces hygroscopicus TaxID=1912 RepID=UPI003638A339